MRLVAVLIIACGTEPPTGFGNACDSGSPCDDPLVCRSNPNGTECTVRCTSNADCRFIGVPRSFCHPGNNTGTLADGSYYCAERPPYE